MYILTIAARHLRTRPIAWVATALIAIVVFLYLLIISVLEGFNHHYMYKLQIVLAHTTVSVGNLAAGIEHPEIWADELTQCDPNIKGITIGLESPAMAIFDSARTVGTLRGVDLKRELEHGRLRELLQPEEVRNTLVEFGVHDVRGKPCPGCIVGGIWRKTYDLKQNDHVIFVFTDEDGEARTKAFKILGFFESSNPYMETAAYVDREFLASHLKVPGKAKTLYVWMRDPDNPALAATRGRIAAKMMELLARDNPGNLSKLEVETWQQKDNNFYQALTRENTIMRAIMVVFLVFIAFIIFLILGRVVAEKVRDVGALRAMGATPSGIRACFLVQGLLIGVVGLGLGFLLSLAIIGPEGRHFNALMAAAGFDLYPQTAFGVDKVPFHTLSFDVLLISGLTMFFALAGSFIPAWWASRLDPVECLRRE